MKKIFVFWAGLSLLPYGLMDLLDSVNGLDYYSAIIVIIFSIYLIIVSFTEKKIEWF
jgi:hypothetical protein